MSATGVPTLKCVIAWSDRRTLCDLLAQALAASGETDMLRLNEDAWLVYTAAEPAEIRDSLATSLGADESVVVMEFERWSGYGPGVDSRWLLRRGH